MALDIKKYGNQTKDFEATLTAGEKVKVSYLPNYLTGASLKKLDKARTDAIESASIGSQYQAYVDHLCLALGDIDMEDDGKKMPFTSDKDKRAALEQLSFGDLQAINEQMQGDLSGPLEPTGTD